MGALSFWGWRDHAQDVQADILSDARAVVSDARHPLVVQVTGRNVFVSGIADDPEDARAVVAALQSIEGVRDVRARLDVLERRTPYITEGWRDADGGRGLSGAVPTEADRVAIGDIALSLDLASGAPPQWLAMASAGQSALIHLHEGRWTLQDESLRLTGIARSQGAHDRAVEALGAARGLDAQVAIAVIPLMSPFTTTAVKTAAETAEDEDDAGGPVTMSGFAPRLADLTVFPGAEQLTRADGAPDDWRDRVQVGHAALAPLVSGEFAVMDETLIVTGVARTRDDRAAAQAALDGLADATADIVLRPRITPYLSEASKGEDGIVTYSGYAPSLYAQRLLDGPSAALTIADGAPQDWEALATAGQAALARLHRGSWLIEGQTLLVEGVARSEEERDAALAQLAAVPADRLVVRITVIPFANPYLFGAVSIGEGKPRLSGFVPSLAARETYGAAGASLVVADGAPPDFGEASAAGMMALDLLARGALSISGQHTHLEGVARSDALREQAIAALRTDIARRVTHNIVVRVLAEPFRTGGLKGEGRAPRLSGHVPSDYGAALLDTSALAIADGAPGNWEALAEAGVTALEALAYGGWQIEGDRLSVQGIARNAEQRAKAQAALAEVAPWTRVAISLRANVSPFVTQIDKDARGVLKYSGFAPPGAALPGLTEADGAPSNWFDMLREAQAAVDMLDAGTVSLEGRRLSLRGVARDDDVIAQVERRLGALEAVSLSLDVVRATARPEESGADKAPLAPTQAAPDAAPAGILREIQPDPPPSLAVAPPPLVPLSEAEPGPDMQDASRPGPQTEREEGADNDT
nr:BON domain-containing protein [Cognatishimia sp. F0-27]